MTSWLKQRSGAGLAVVLAASASIACSLPPVASAGVYDVEVCTPNSLAGDGIVIENSAPNIFSASCRDLLGQGIRQVAFGVVRVEERTAWRLQAPADTTITEAEINRSFSGEGKGVRYSLFSLRPFKVLLEQSIFPAQVPNGVKVFSTQAVALEGELECNNGGGDCDLTGGGPPAVVDNRAISVELEDDSRPLVSMGGPIFSGGEAGVGGVVGVQEVTFEASDRGSGIARAELQVDGTKVLSTDLDNDGRCALPYKFLVPCALNPTSSFLLDTATLSDGDHQVRVRVFDAGGLDGSTAPLTVRIRNAPTSVAAPELSGAAEVGAELVASAGGWTGAPPPSFAFQWLRCPADVSTAAGAASCVEIAGAGPRRTLDQADLGHRMMVRVTASNQKGRAVANSAPSGPVARSSASAPVLSAVSVSPKRVRSTRRATLRLTSSEPARLSIAIERMLPGRRVNGACEPVRRVAGAGRCRVPRLVIGRDRAIEAGSSKLPLVARVLLRAMVPGRYRLTLTATDADGNASEAVRVPFAVVG